jgi:beta-lactamase class D
MSGVVSIFLLSTAFASQDSQPVTREIDLKKQFGDFPGCMVVYDVQAGVLSRYNPKRCEARFAPASTFKIPNSLIGLETGVITDAGMTLKWDGKKYSNPNASRDHDLRSAFKNSVLWYYQECARRVGEARMRDWVSKLDYGNHDTSGGVDRFWLGDGLQISADEQVAFVDRLRRGDLPVSHRSQDIVRDIMVHREEGGVVLRGKTGTAGKNDKAVLGWFVGWVTRDGRDYVFAANISANEGAMGTKTREIVEKSLISLGILPEPAATTNSK